MRIDFLELGCCRFKDTLLRWKMKPEVAHGNEKAISREFKLEAVKLVKERGESVAQAAPDLDVHENVLRKWVREATADPQQAFPGQGAMKPEQAELEHLRKENVKLRMERDLSKKAVAYFAKESM